jgi:hypothetical protein
MRLMGGLDARTTEDQVTFDSADGRVRAGRRDMIKRASRQLS